MFPEKKNPEMKGKYINRQTEKYKIIEL